LPSKYTKIIPVISVMGLPPKSCKANASKISQFFRFGSHPCKLAALRATIGLIITSYYRTKLINTEAFVTS